MAKEMETLFLLARDIIQLLHADFDEVDVDYCSRKYISHVFCLAAGGEISPQIWE